MADLSFAMVLRRAFAVAKASPPGLSGVDNRGGWWPLIRESFTGAWQRNVTVTVDSAAANPVLFRVLSLISGDIAKMRLRLVDLDKDGIWNEVTRSSPFWPVIRKPNRYQNRIQFITCWVLSKLTFGNTYVLKVRDERGVVVGLYVLNPQRVKPLVAEDGSVWYQLGSDDLSSLPVDRPYVPASEIIHDRWNTLFHPLVGLSPIFACGLAALQAQEIQSTSVNFFRNGSQPGGVLTAPGHIDPENAARLKELWEEKYTGANAGRVAILGDGLTYQPMAVNAVDAQLIERLKWSGVTICGCYGVPPYMAAVGEAPLNNNVQSLVEQYYSQCLQIHIESIELCLDEGLGIGLGAPKEGVTYGTEFDLDDLLRMDSATQVKTLAEGVKGGIYKPNEARLRVNMPPVTGGDAVYLQQQNFSLEALAKRDAKEDPFGTKASDDAAETDPGPVANDNAAAAQAAAFWRIRQGFKGGLAHVRR
jgi:HK97 family phage portal protein